ncbi:MAG: tetratricopeptide repeat protein [Flavobacteriales bacterium]|nr:tetratricopeptide repeat protein [Flavobacteriales bacterium]
MKFFSGEVHPIRWPRLLFISFLGLSLLFACSTGADEEGNRSAVSTDLSVSDQIAEYTGQINANRMNATAFHKRAQLYLFDRNLGSAMDDIAVAIKIDDKVADYHYTLSDVHFAGGNVVLATEALADGLQLDPENVHALLAQAQLYYALRDMKNSVVTLKRVLEVDKHNAKAYLIHGLIFSELGDTTRAMNSFQTAVENDPQLEEAHLELGLIHYAELNPLAVNYLDNVIALNPQNTLAMYTKSMYYQKTSEVDLAIDGYNQILGVNPNHAESHYNLGHIQIEFKEDYKGAVAHFSNAIKADSTHYKAFYMRGVSLERQTMYPEARRDYLKSLDLQTNYELAIQGLNRLDKLGQ